MKSLAPRNKSCIKAFPPSILFPLCSIHLPHGWLTTDDASSVLWGPSRALGLYSRAAAALARTTQKGPGGSMWGDFRVLSLPFFFIWDHGAGGSHFLWPFQVVLTRASERNWSQQSHCDLGDKECTSQPMQGSRNTLRAQDFVQFAYGNCWEEVGGSPWGDAWQSYEFQKDLTC